MLEPKPKNYRLPPLSTHKKTFDDLCLWIDAHLGGPVGWQELMSQSGLDHQTINALFYKYESTTPMTWIRRRREAGSSSPEKVLPTLLLSKQKSQ